LGGGDVSGQWRNRTDDLLDYLVGCSCGGEAFGEMARDELEVVHGDSSVLMDLPHRAPA
jgi:hypothetical protein